MCLFSACKFSYWEFSGLERLNCCSSNFAYHGCTFFNFFFMLLLYFKASLFVLKWTSTTGIPFPPSSTNLFRNAKVHITKPKPIRLWDVLPPRRRRIMYAQFINKVNSDVEEQFRFLVSVPIGWNLFCCLLYVCSLAVRGDARSHVTCMNIFPTLGLQDKMFDQKWNWSKAYHLWQWGIQFSNLYKVKFSLFFFFSGIVRSRKVVRCVYLTFTSHYLVVVVIKTPSTPPKSRFSILNFWCHKYLCREMNGVVIDAL